MEDVLVSMQAYFFFFLLNSINSFAQQTTPDIKKTMETIQSIYNDIIYKLLSLAEKCMVMLVDRPVSVMCHPPICGAEGPQLLSRA